MEAAMGLVQRMGMPAVLQLCRERELSVGDDGDGDGDER
jgi:hypothetical protein